MAHTVFHQVQHSSTITFHNVAHLGVVELKLVFQPITEVLEQLDMPGEAFRVSLSVSSVYSSLHVNQFLINSVVVVI